MAEKLSVAASRSARFRELLKKPPFVCMGAHDAVTAKLAEQAGAPAIYVSGFVASAIVAGAPDFGVLTQTEMFEHIRRICRVTTVPVFADADTGYGGVLDAQRTIQLWEEAGASVLHLEDQAMPKKCGHFAGKELISAEEMQQKLRAMLAARRDPDFFVVARTDAMGVTDLDDAIRRLEVLRRRRRRRPLRRCAAQRRAIEGDRAALEAAGIAAAVQHGAIGQEPVLTLKEVHELGFDYALCPVEPMLAMHKAVKEMMETFMREGCSTDAIADRLTPFHEFNDFIGLDEIVAREKQFTS